MRFLFLLLLTISTYSLSAQSDSLTTQPEKQHRFYFYWGYNRTWFSTSTIHFSGPEYDFTVYDLKAKDRPTKFGWVYLDPTRLSIPQYNWRFGYALRKRFWVSAGWDHMKYVVNQGQWTTISGVVTEKISPKYAGSYLNQPIKLETDLLRFEHTNGFNLISLDAEWWFPLYKKRPNDRKLRAYWMLGTGGIWMITKTDVHVFEDGLDNRFHLSGLAFTGKTGPILEWHKRWFLSAQLRSGYVNLPWVPIKNEAPERADHQVFFWEMIFMGGIRF
ncbi:MAG: hypothetical protein WCR52_11295 [Bacteroidota bacterium]